MTQIFKKTDRSIYSLVEGIKKHDIGLPELQRPYVWDRARVRDLFDSLYRGYPTGLLIFLENERETQTKAFGKDNELKKIPQYVVIDGQQRLTALYAALTGFEVIKPGGKKEKIIISFNPLEGVFKVADAGTKRGGDWLYDIKELVYGNNILGISNDYLKKYKERYGENSEVEQEIAQNIQKVSNIKNIAFSCIEIFKYVPIEIVSEVFLRINSRGKTLNNSDFILTLMSVYREEGRKLVEEFSQYTQKRNDIAQLKPDEVIRILIGVGLKRSKLEDTYNFLKGKREEFLTLGKVAEIVTNKHQRTNFLLLIKDLGFIHKSLITQQSLIISCYILYLIGITEYQLTFQEIGPIIKQYYLTMFLAQKYSSNSFETVLGKDFLKIQKIKTASAYIDFIKNEISLQLTPDSRKIKFTNNIVTSSIRSPLFIAYTASQIFSQKNLMFRSVPISKMFIDLKDKEALGEKIDIDIHHIFPRQYLLDNYGVDGIGFTDINQIANKVYIYNSDNKTISKKSPSEYLPLFSGNGSVSLEKNLENNAIPSYIGDLSYEDFLKERRTRMLDMIKNYVEKVMSPETVAKTTIENLSELIRIGENHNVEFKSSYRWDYHQEKRNDNLKYQIVKTIAAFLNSEGGTLFVGIKDDKNILGIEKDISLFNDNDIDSLLLDVDNLIKNHFSQSYALIKVFVEVLDGKQILVFKIEPSNKETYFNKEGKREFFIRRSASSIALTIEEAVNYIKEHF